jgi:hypothetical protein
MIIIMQWQRCGLKVNETTDMRFRRAKREDGMRGTIRLEPRAALPPESAGIGPQRGHARSAVERARAAYALEPRAADDDRAGGTDRAVGIAETD